MKTRIVIYWILILIVIDQSIKIIINTYFGDCRFEIIPSLIEFIPTFNAKHSWVNTLLNENFGIDVGLLPHIILYLLIGILITVYFSYLRHNIPNNKKLIDASIIFLMATLFCALIGNLIWKNGTLDYIYLKPLFVFDLKDLYSDFGVALFLIYAFKNRNLLKNRIKTRDVFLYAKNKLKMDKK
jgi:hypothetical protein